MTMRITSLLIGYVLGCFLTADVVSYTFAHKSAFDVGVGNPGMANIGHELGKKAALLVLAGDIAKTIAGWLIARALYPDVALLAGMWAGLGATLGHNYPIWHRFCGGKGVTTTCSAIILASPLLGIGSCLFGLLAAILSGYLCVGAVAICVCWLALVATIHMSAEFFLIALALLVLMVIAHGSTLRGISSGSTARAGISTKIRGILHR